MMAEKRYRCIKEFYVPLCDDDGCEVDGGEMVPVEIGEMFRRSDVTWINDVRLEGVENTYTWLEISEETFGKCFEEVAE